MPDQAIREMLVTPSCWQARLPCHLARTGILPFDSDVVIVGAGIGGLAAAIRALESGYSVTVLEAGNVGCGASGRNSGFVVPIPSRHSAQSLQRMLGEHTVPFLGALRGAAHDVFEYAAPDLPSVFASTSISTSTSTIKGWVQPLVQTTTVEAAQQVRGWRQLGVNVEAMEPEALKAAIATSEYSQGLHFSDAGAIDPLALVHQMADSINRMGGQIIEGCVVSDVSPKQRWVGVRTELGEIKAGRVFIAGNAYGVAASRDTRRAVSPLILTLATFAVPPLYGNCEVLPFSDNRKDMWFARRLGPSKLLTGCFALPLPRACHTSRQLLQARIQRLYATPVQAPEQHWAGWVGLTGDGMPIIRNDDERIMEWSGCNGRGIALSMLMGQTLMDRLCTGSGLPFPISTRALLSSATTTMKWLAQMVIALDRLKQRRTALTT